MNKFNVHDILRAILIVLLSLVAWIGRGIHTQQADIDRRLRVVELNQAKMMGVMGVEPCALESGKQRYTFSFSQ